MTFEKGKQFEINNNFSLETRNINLIINLSFTSSTMKV